MIEIRDRKHPERTTVNMSIFEAFEYSTLESPFMSTYAHNGIRYQVSAGGTWHLHRGSNRGEGETTAGCERKGARAAAKMVRETWGTPAKGIPLKKKVIFGHFKVSLDHRYPF